MANKKKRRRQHRHPVAPPVHSAPGTAPVVQRSTQPPPGRPVGAEPPTAAAPERTEAPRRVRQTPQQRQSARRRRARRRNWLVFGTMGAVVAVLIIGSLVMSRRSAGNFNALMRAEGCGEVKATSDSGAGEHLQEGEKTDYDTSPPTHGEHAGATLPSGVYDEPLSDNPSEDLTIYKAVHSLEHGGVIVWYDKLSDDDVRELEREARGEQKVLLIPYPPLKGKTHMAMTAWGRMVECEKASTKAVDAFVDRFRSARSAPEPNNSI